MVHFYSETEVVATLDGMSVARLRSFVATNSVAPAEREGRLAFTDADVARLRLLADLTQDFELDEETAAMVLSLLDQIHGLRRRLREVGVAIAAEPEEVKARICARVPDEDRLG